MRTQRVHWRVRLAAALLARSMGKRVTLGRENVPSERGALLVANHVTRIDALLLCAALKRRIRFVMSPDLDARHWTRFIMRKLPRLLLSPADPPRRVVTVARAVKEAVNAGELVCVFPELAPTRNGNLQPFHAGLRQMVKKIEFPIVPVHIGGVWGKPFSYGGRGKPRARHNGKTLPVSVVCGKPLPPGTAVTDIRQAVQELSAAEYDLRKSPDRNLGMAFIRCARKHWFKTAFADSMGRRLRYGSALTAAIALAPEIKKLCPRNNHVGILLPPTVAAVLANLAVTLLGKIPINLSYSTSQDALVSAIRQGGARPVITSRAFLARLERIELSENTVFLEDLRPLITTGKRIRALLKARFLPARRLVDGPMPGPDDLATILFSSGSVADPKGVMLSHHNVLCNIEAFCTVFEFRPVDRMCAVLPFFHSFGFTCTLWCPAISAFSAFYHVSPLEAGKIAELIRIHRLTVLLTTPTFLQGYTRRASSEDLESLRCVIVGAEKMKSYIADAFAEKFGFRPLEGYGATELSPVAALNLPDREAGDTVQVGTKEGSIGHPIPGVAMKIVDPESHRPIPEDEEGMLMVRGPNVMLGYLGKPEMTEQVIHGEWYESGDIASMDADGFVFIHDRLARFSKIGGEMVPHEAIEDCLAKALSTVEQRVIVSSAHDAKKGEQLVVFYTEEAGSAEDLYRIVKDSDLPNLWKPKKENFVKIDAIPALGSGKLDLKSVRSMAQQYVDLRPTFLQRMAARLREARKT